MNFTKSKIALGVAGTIFLGVISSAIWEGVKPFTKWVYEQALYVSVLGIDKLKDGIYIDIAKGHHENASLEIYTLIYSILLGSIIGIMVIAALLHMYENGNDGMANKLKKLIEFPRKLQGRSFLLFIIFYTIFAVTIYSFDLVKTKYINEAVTYYEQLVSIVTPYIEQQQIDQMNSEFAQINSKSDYESVINNLLEIVDENNLEKPQFSFIF